MGVKPLCFTIDSFQLYLSVAQTYSKYKKLTYLVSIHCMAVLQFDWSAKKICCSFCVVKLLNPNHLNRVGT